MSSTKGKSNAPWNECIGQMKGQQGVSRRNAQADSLRLDDFLGAKFKGTNYKIGTSPAFQVGNRYGIDPDLLKGVKKIPSQYIIASSGQVLDGENTGDIFGWSTDLSEDGLTLAVGSILNDNTNGTNSGSVRVYARSDPEEAWVQKGVDIDGEAAQDYSGWAVALSADGDRLVVGAVFNDDGGNINAGHVRIYDWNAGTSQWVSVAEFNGGVAGDFFGYSVALSRNKTRLAVGAPYGLDERGYVSVYEYDGTAWQHVTTINGVLDEGRFGKVVALNDDGSRLVVSAPHALGDTGVVYFYDGSANLLAEKTGPGLGVKFGHALDLRGHTLAVADITSAPLKIFDVSSDTFVAQTAPTGIFRSTEAKVKLSQDGNVLLFSMPAINTEDNVINSTAVQELSKVGLVKIFARDGDAWKQRGWDMKSYASNNDEFGKSINVSGDGLVICISAPRKDDFSTDRGCVTAYTVRPISYYVKPTITLLGLNPQPVEANTRYVEAGAVTDTGATVTIVGDIEDNSVEGREYTVRYTAASAFETTTVERTIVITKNPTVPEITLNGDPTMKVPIGGVFNDPGASSNIPASITTDTSGVDFQRVGVYEIKYTAVSIYGISSVTLTRRVFVVYDIELETVDLVGRAARLSKDGFIAGTGDFLQNQVTLYEWNPISPVSWKKVGQTIRAHVTGSAFGASLDLSTDGLTVAIGAPGLSGLVRVFQYNFLVNAWEQKGDDITGVDDGDKIGDFLCISGDGNVVSTGSATPTSSKTPYAFSYRYSAATETWTKFHEYVEPLKLPSNVASKPFSGSLNSSGSRLLLGAPVNNYTTGAIFLFDLNTDQKLVSIFGDAVGAYLGQSVKLTPTGDTFVYGDVSAACVKVYAANAATGFWGQMGESITESYSSGGEFGKHVDISSDGTIVTFSDPSTVVGQGQIYQYAWDALNSTWIANMVEVKDNITGSFFGRKFYVTEDASKILTESTVSFQYFRWNVARPVFSINGTRILRLSIDQEYDETGYVASLADIAVTGVVNTAVTKDYVVKYTMTNDLNLSEVAYQIVSVSGGLLQLGFDVKNFDASSTPVNFGRSASMSSDGSLIAVGAPGFDGDTGMVKIYQFNPATVQWDLQATVLGPSTGSSFGYSVCLSKNGARLAIGAPDTANGLVRVYASSGGAWNQLGSDLTGTTGGKFGFSVALNLEGSHLTVGEPRKVFDVNTGAGVVRTYEYVTQWTEVSSMVNNQLEHELGYGVAITSTTNVFLAGAPMAGPGYVKLSTYGGGNIPLFAPTFVFGEKFGWSVSISDDGHTFAVGAPYYNNKTGRVLVYDATTSPPSPKGSPIVGEAPLLEFGLSVHVSGNGQKLMVYAGNGRVSTFQFTNSQWTANADEIITSSETNAQFGYALASSGDGRRMLISTPLSDLVQVYSTETTQITNADFVGPTLTLNGPATFTVGQGEVFTDPGVRRDDGFSEFITTGAVDGNVLDTYNLTYSAIDNSGNPSLNTVNRDVTVISNQSNNALSLPAVNSSHNNNNACVQMSNDGTRFAVASGAPATTYVSDQVSASNAQGLHGSVVVYEINESSSPITFTQVDEITDVKPNFATAIQMNRDGTRIAAMHTLDSSSTEISVYGTGNDLHTPRTVPFPDLETSSFNFGLPIYASIAPITDHPGNLFGRSGDRQSYRYKNLATSSDGKVVAIGKPTDDGTDRVSVYRQVGDTATLGTLVQYGNTISPTGLTSTRSDISSTGDKIIFSADDTTFIYKKSSGGLVKEQEFVFIERTANAMSDDGAVVALNAAAESAFFPITLIGGDRVSITLGSSWSDPGFTYVGLDTVTVTGTVDTSQEGEYIVQYQATNITQIRIVSVESILTGSHSATNVPYGPGFAGWTGTWRHYDFDVFTVPAGFQPVGSITLSITLNGRIPVPGHWQYQSIVIFTDFYTFFSSIDFTSNANGSEDSVTYGYGSSTGTTYTNHRKTATTTVGSLSPGDVVKGRLYLKNTYYKTFSVDVKADYSLIPTITLTGLSENVISIGENFVDPGFTSDDPSDTLSTYITAALPKFVPCKQPIVYRAVSTTGIIAYAVRYVEVVGAGGESRVLMYQHLDGGWSQMAEPIYLPKPLDFQDSEVALSESGYRVAISKYVLGQGSIFTYEYNELTFPPSWVQYGSVIEISSNNRKPGSTLALSGDGSRLVVGSPGDANNAGEVYVYDFDIATQAWVRRNQDLWSLTTSNFDSAGVTNYSMDLYGHSVDISKDGAYIAVGSPPNTTGRGHVSVYTLANGAFVLKGDPVIASVSQPEFGRYVSMTSAGLDFATNFGASDVMWYRFTFKWVQFTSKSFSAPVVSVAISEEGDDILAVTDVVEVHTIVETEVPGGQWEQVGSDITLASVTAPGVDANPSPSAGSRYSPGIFKPTGNTNITGYAVDLSHDGTVLAIGLPFLEIGGGDPFVVNSRGAAAVFNYDGSTWNQVGGTIVPKYVYDNALTSKYDGVTGVTVLNELAEANTFSGAEVSISGDGQYICVGSPGYLSNPIDVQPMDSLPNEGGMTFWTLYRRNESWAPTNDLYNVGWEPVVRRDSELSASLSGYNPQSGSVNEKKRELLGLGLKVSSDGSMVVFDTRTDGVKILAESSGVWSVHGLLDDGLPPKPVPATTDFLVARNMLNPPAVNTTYTQQPSAAVGFGNFPAKYWPVSYISLSTNDKFLSVSNPLLDPLDRATSTTNQQVEDLRLGRVTVFKSSSSTNFTVLGDAIVGDTDAYTWGVDDFAYSHSTISDNGLTMVIPRGVIPALLDVQEYEKRISIYDFDRDTNAWGLRVSSVVEGTGVSTATFPVEYNFLTVLTKNRSAVSALYFGPTQPVFRQYLVSTTIVQSSYNKVSTLSMASQNLNAQPFPLDPLLPNERIADFAMSDDGIKIAIGNARGVTGFTTINANKEMGSVSVFTYDTSAEEWGSQVLLSVPDTSTYVNSGFVSAQFGTRVKFLPDGNTLVVSAPTSRNGLGDIFFFDTSSTTAIAQKTIPYANPSTGSQGMFGSSLGISDDYTRLFVGDPGHDSGMGRIAVVEYDESSSSWSGTPQYITRNRVLEAYDRPPTVITLTGVLVYNYYGYYNYEPDILNNNGGYWGGIPFGLIEWFVTTSYYWGTQLIYSTQSYVEQFSFRLVGNAPSYGPSPNYVPSYANQNQDRGLWLPVNFGPNWSVSFQWWFRKGNEGDMRFIFFAPNQPTSYAGHGGYQVIHPELEHQIADPTGASLSTVQTTYDGISGVGINDPTRGFSTVTISYDRGVLTTNVSGAVSTNRTYTFTGSDLSAQEALWWTTTYIAIAGRSGSQATRREDNIRNINVTYEYEYSLYENVMFGRDFDVTSNGDRLVSSLLGKLGRHSPTVTLTETFQEYLQLNSGLEVAEVMERNATTGVWGLSGEVPERLKIQPTGALQSLAENMSIRPTAKISGNGLYFMFGIPSLYALNGTGGIERQTNDLNIVGNYYPVTPTISLVGDAVITITTGTSLVDPGAVAYLFGLSLPVVVSGDVVDVNTVGTYVVRYTVTKVLTNFVERTFIVTVPSDPPTLTLLGSASVSLVVGNPYTEPDPPVTFTGGGLERYGDPPSGDVPGTFTIRYLVRNSLGVVSVQRTVTVEPDTTPPVITILGGDVVHKFKTTYRDPSYLQSDGNEDVFTTTPEHLLTSRDIGNYLGTTQVTYSATDQIGNVGTTVRNVTVKDEFETIPVQQTETGHSWTLSSTGNRVAVMDQSAVSIYETGGALVNSWSGMGSLQGQMVQLNSDGTVVAFTTTVGVYVYEYTTSWIERSPHSSYPRFTVPGSAAYRIELSDDGDTLAVSYPGGTTTFFDEVAVFRWNATTYDLDYNQGSTTSIGSMSLNSTGTRLVLGYPNFSFSGASINTGSGYRDFPEGLNGVSYDAFSGDFKLTNLWRYGENNTMFWRINLGSVWSVTWDWYIYGPHWGGADDMRLIYYAPNPITAYQASVHGGYNNFYEFWEGDTHQIRDNTDVYKKSENVYYGTNRWLTVRVSYDNGVMTSSVRVKYWWQAFNPHVSTMTYDFGDAHQHLYGTPTYFGFSGRTGGVTSSQWIRNIQFSEFVTNSGAIEVLDRAGPASWSQVGSDIKGGQTNQKLGTVVKISGDGSRILNINEGRDGNDQKLSVFTLNSGTWTKNPINAVERTFDTGDGNDLADISDDGSFLVYAKGTGTELYATHPQGLASKYLDGFKLDGGVYRHVVQAPVPSASTNRVALAGDASRVLVLNGEEPSVFDVNETVFDPIITLNQSDDLDTLTVVGGAYTEQGATSNVTDESSVTVGGDTVTATPGTYRVTYSVTDSNTGRSGFRSRVMIVT